MYFAYGWPKLYSTGCELDNEFLFLQFDQDYLLAVNRTCVQVWSGGQHRIRLGEHARSEADVEEDGVNVCAVWCTSKATLAVLTSKNRLHLYGVHVWKEPLLPSTLPSAQGIARTDVYLRSSRALEGSARGTSLTGDARVLAVGFEDGSLAAYSWTGKLRQTCAPLPELLQGGSSPPSSSSLAASQQQPPRPSSSSFDLPAQRGGLSAPSSSSRAIVQLGYDESTKLLAVVLGSGACAIMALPDSGLAQLAELAFVHWACDREQGAVCAHIGAPAQMVAVGCASGDVLLCRLHPQQPDGGEVAAPLRTLSLQPWGHTGRQLGPAAQLAWTPGCKALAVGYARQGLAVWSPSGCRLMCSLRQTPSLNASTSRSSSARASETNPTPAGASSSSGGERLEDLPSLEMPISALAWGPHGYQLLLGEALNGGCLYELQFARTLPSHHRVAHALTASDSVPQLPQGQSPVSEELHVLLAHDRLLVISEAAEASQAATAAAYSGGEAASGSNDLVVQHAAVPASYLAANWPLMHAALSAMTLDVAVAGRRGLALYSCAAEKWRLIGDVSQERRIACQGLAWLGSIIVAVSGPEEPALPGGAPAKPALASSARGADGKPRRHELLLFPRYHLDFASLLAQYPLPGPIMAIDCVGSHILIASEPLDIALLHVSVQGELTPLGSPKAIITVVREISMLNMGNPLLELACVPPAATAVLGSSASQANGGGGKQPKQTVPSQCILLRWGGVMSVLDMAKGSELALSSDVEVFWLSDSISCALPESLSGKQGSGPPQMDVEMPWWAHGPAGMQLWFPSSLSRQLLHKGAMSAGLRGRPANEDGYQDIELEFDAEVYPIGISLADASIIGVTQRVLRGLGGSSLQPGAGHFPCFHLVPESQPVLPCLLRRLLHRGALQEALSLAARHSRGPHFVRSLEWLLFTCLELNASNPLSKRTAGSSSAAAAAAADQPGSAASGSTAAAAAQQQLPVAISSLLHSAAELIRHFPQHCADVVVSVARKTDAALWPALFSAVGSPSVLLERLLEQGSLASASCFLLIIDRLEGSGQTGLQVLRLVRASLRRSQYQLTGELLRFIIPPADLLPPGPAPGGAGAAAAPPKASGWAQWLYDLVVGQPLPPGSSSPAASASASSAQRPQAAGAHSAQQVAARAEARQAAAAGSGNAGSSQPASRRATMQHGGSGEALASPPPGLTLPQEARWLVAQHAWLLVEAGHMRAVAQLAHAVSFIPHGLAALMQAHRDSPAAAHCTRIPSPADLLATLSAALSEFPVWEAEAVEQEGMAALMVALHVGCHVWSVCLGVVLVDSPSVQAFRREAPQVWYQFSHLIKADQRYAFLHDIVDAMSLAPL